METLAAHHSEAQKQAPQQKIVLRTISTSQNQSWESDKHLRIGRSESSEVALDDASISRRHAEVFCGPGGWVVRDLGSTNGTLLNGVRLGRIEQKIRRHDVIQPGSIVLVVEELQEKTRSAEPAAHGRNQAQTRKVRPVPDTAELAGLAETRTLLPEEQIITLIQCNQHIHKIDSPDEALQTNLNDVVTAFQAQHGAILLTDESSGRLDLRIVAAREGNASNGEPYSSTLTRRCFERGESLLCRDTSEESELPKSRSINGCGMRSIICALLRTPRRRLGVLHLDRGPVDPPFTSQDLRVVDALASTMSVGIENALNQLDKQRDLFVQTLIALAQAIDCRDHYTGGHTQRVTDYALILAEELQVSTNDYRNLQIGTPLHDIGKIGIDDIVLRKPGQLSLEEFEQIKSHPLKGVAILEGIPQLSPILPIVRNHHERWDGKGYPDRLAGEQISRLARIVTVADVFDALTSDRPYRVALTCDEAFAFIKKGSENHFDPACAAAFMALRPEIEQMLRERGRLNETISKADLKMHLERFRKSQ